MEICINFYQASFSITCLETGKMPVQQKLNFLVQEASRSFFKNSTFLWNGPESPFLKTPFSCGTGILPVLEKLNFLVERAGEPVLENSIFLWNGPESPFLRLVQPMAAINLADRENTPHTNCISQCNNCPPASPNPYYLI
jgi:hypothetical protein